MGVGSGEDDTTRTQKQKFVDSWTEVWESYKEGYDLKWLIVSIKLPSGTIEVILNSQNLEEKFQYYLDNYDDDLKLKTFDKIQILNWIIA